MKIQLPPVPDLVMVKITKSRGRGRPRKTALPAIDQAVEAVQRAREMELRKDPLTKALREDPNSLNVLDEIMVKLAEENAALHFERTEAERRGQETTIISQRKVTALRSVADVYLKKREAVVDNAFDLKSKRFQKFMEWILIQIRQAAVKAGLSTEQINILFDQIAKTFEDDRWQTEALEHIKKD